MTRLLALWLVWVPLGGTAPIDRIDRVEHWVAAVEHHIPGTLDDPAVEVATWTNPDLQRLWTDLWAFGQLLREPRATYFTIKPRGTNREQRVYYSPNDLKRLRDLARRTAKAHDRIDLLQRGALLHSDIAMNIVSAPEAVGSPYGYAPERLTMHVGDGQSLDLVQTAIHWETAQMLLDSAGRDETMRVWYRATATWMAQHEQLDLAHVERGRKLFSDDPDLLFLTGCLHEVRASAHIQAAVRSAPLPSGFSFGVGRSAGELRDAEDLLRHAVEVKPVFAEARLHLGRVLELLGQHPAAVRELERAEATLDDEELVYVAELFLGATYEGSGQFDRAGAAYHRAARRFPDAQSPLLALSQLARRQGDRSGALAAMKRIFALPDVMDRDDPFWRYLVSQGRHADDRLDELRRPFMPEALR